MSKSQKTSKQSEKEKSSKPTILRWCINTSIKIFIAVLFITGFYAVYLDSKVRNKFEGQRWNVPVQVYGEIPRFHLGENISIAALTHILKLTGYKKVRQVTKAGEFAASSTKIIIYRRAFDFGNGISAAEKLVISIIDGRIFALSQGEEARDTIALEPYFIDRLVPENKEDRLLLPLESVPEQLIDTLLLIEDRNFYFHSGISPLGILRALIANIVAGKTVQGGSTLTQQLVKNMYLTREKTLLRKLNEAVMALILELRYSKDQLLEAYINEVYLGQNYANGIYGFGLAAEFYFGESIQHLTPEQMAMLIGQVKGPSYYDPWRFPENTLKRRDLVLRLMYQEEYLSQQQFQKAVESPLSVRQSRRMKKQKFPAYLQLVRNELSGYLSEHDLQSGIRVFTGFSITAQMALEQTLYEQMPELEKANGKENLEAAMLVTDIESSEVKAMAGGKAKGYAGFNRALHAKRPIGSLIKPAIYLAALERFQQYNLATVLADEPIALVSDNGTKWQPKNYNGKFNGQVNLIDGLVKSLNVPTVNLGMAIGLGNVADVIHLLGFPDDIVTRPSMLLGSLNMSPYEVNQFYLPLAKQGVLTKSHAIDKVVSGQGETLWQFEEKPEHVFSEQGMYLLDYGLSQVTKSGTARSLTWRLKGAELAGKTGTTNEQRDSWFVGYDNQHLVTTWLGRDDNQPTQLTGSSGALVLFADYMKRVGVENKQRTMPENIMMTAFERSSGNAILGVCDGLLTLPAISTGLLIDIHCSTLLQSNERLQNGELPVEKSANENSVEESGAKETKGKKKSWLERLFGA
jgi:penicillin-binding protein 1B